MADFTISRSTGLMNAEPCGSVSATSIQTTSTQNNFLQGKPLEDLGRMAVSEGNIVYITQQQDEQATSQNEAAPFEGVSLGANYANPIRGVACSIAGTAEMTQNEAVLEEVQNINKTGLQTSEGLSFSFYQQQLMLNHQIMLQQQQTVNSLIGKVESLEKRVDNKEKTSEKTVSNTQITQGKLNSLPKHRAYNSHAISDTSIEDVSSASERSGEESDGYSSEEDANQPLSVGADNLTTNLVPKDKVKITSNMDLLREMGKGFENLETCGSKVNDTLANVVDSGIRAQIDRSLAKEACNKYARPENCQALRVPKINKELWNTSSLAKATKEQDKAFQTTQKYLNQGLIPLVQLMDGLLKDENAEQQFKLARDSFQLLAYAHRDMSNLRRQLVKSVVADKYKQLCNDSTPLTENLLGDELEKQIKTMDEMRKVGKDLTKYRGEKRKRSGHEQESVKKYQRSSFNRPAYKTNERTDRQSFLAKRARYHKPGFHKTVNKKNHKQ